MSAQPHAPLSILFVSIEYPPETPDGIGTFVKGTAAALAARGHQVHVLSCAPAQESRDDRDGLVHVHRRNVRRLTGLGSAVGAPLTLRRLAHALSCRRAFAALRTRFDVIDAADWMAEGLAFAFGPGPPLVVTLHTPLAVTSSYGGRPQGADLRAAASLERLAAERAVVVTAPSALVVQEVQDRGWLKGRAIPIVPPGLSLSRAPSSASAADTPPRLLCVGRLERLKAPELAIDALARLRDVADAEVVFVGQSSTRDGSDYAEWLRLRADAAAVRATFLGQLPAAEVAAWSARSRVVVVPSRYENFPFAALEAMAAARPVVCTTNTGIADLITRGAGSVCAPDDPDALAAALRPYLVDPARAARAGSVGRRLASLHADPDRTAARREACYLEAITRGRTRRLLRPRYRNASGTGAEPERSQASG